MGPATSETRRSSTLSRPRAASLAGLLNMEGVSFEGSLNSARCEGVSHLPAIHWLCRDCDLACSDWNWLGAACARKDPEEPKVLGR